MKGRWIGVSDLMSGLMMVFLFVCISLLTKEQNENKDIKKKIEETEKISKRINEILDREFKTDFKKWGAERLMDGTIRFKTPEIMFSQGRHNIKKEFQKILQDFCPRYIDSIRDNFDPKDIHEIRIEGHSSSEWSTNRPRKRHTSNAELSLNRSWEVHKFCYDNLKSGHQKRWFSDRAVTVGANSVHRIKNSSGMEIKSLSRRVEFRIQPKSLSELREEFIKLGQKSGRMD